MDLRTVGLVLALAGVVALVVAVLSRTSAARGRRRERAAVPAQGVVRSVVYTDEGTSVRLGVAWYAPDGSGPREGVWHGGGGPGPGFQVGQPVPLRVDPSGSWVQVAGPARQSTVDGCGSVVAAVLGVALLAGAVWLLR